MLPLYTGLFNHVLHSGEIPSSWLVGKIVPLYKEKGDSTKAENYRGISLLSCFGKMFTSLLNTRLTAFIDDNNILSENQAGFRRSYSTIDHIFLLNTVISMFHARRKKLFCAFVDLRRAFDSIWRVGLWEKLVNSGIKGKVLRIVVNMYKDIKSCVFAQGQTSEYFGCYKGVRQGENLSPLLFSMYLNDVETYLRGSGVPVLSLDETFDNMFNLMILLYADDAVLMANTPGGLQIALDAFAEYCRSWKLAVNIQKTKIVVFSKRKTKRYNTEFKLDGFQLEVMDQFSYLGVLFSYNGSFLMHRKNKFNQANKSMFALLKTIRQLSLPIDLQLELFDRVVVPVLIYGCEVWGYEGLDTLEK